MSQIYLNTQKLGPYNNAEKLAVNLLNRTQERIYVYQSKIWNNLDNWPIILHKDYDGRISWGDNLPNKHDTIINFNSRVNYRVEKDNHNINLNTEYLKFTNEISCSEKRITELNTRLKNEKDIVVIGSVWKHEMDILQYFIDELKDYNIIIAPRQLDWMDDLTNYLKDKNFGFRSKGNNFKDKDILILDSLGELKEIYSLGHINLICGGIEKMGYRGGHNPLESLVYLKPTLIGEDIANHKIIVRYLKENPLLEIAESNNVLSLKKSFKKLDDITKSKGYKNHQKLLKNKLDRSVHETQKTIDELVKLI